MTKAICFITLAPENVDVTNWDSVTACSFLSFCKYSNELQVDIVLCIYSFGCIITFIVIYYLEYRIDHDFFICAVLTNITLSISTMYYMIVIDISMA